MDPRVESALHVLVVRLRPDSPDIAYQGILSNEVWQLGYLGLCRVGFLGASAADVVAALERFAGGRLIRTRRQLLDLDPRLRPDML